MFFTLQNTLLALAATSILPSVLAGPLPGANIDVEARDPDPHHHHHHDHEHHHFHHSLSFAERKSIAIGKKLLVQAAKLSDKTKWEKEGKHANWTQYYGPLPKYNFKSGVLSIENQKYLDDILKEFSIDVKTQKFQKFIVFQRKGLVNGIHPPNGTEPSNSTSTTGGGKETDEKHEHVSHHHHFHAHNRHPRLPILRAAISPNAVVLKALHKSHDHNKKRHQLHLSELLYQGLKETGSKATTFVRVAPRGETMRHFIKKAVRAADDKGVLKFDTKDRFQKKMFAMMLGTPAGRTVEMVCIRHPSWFGGKSVKEIRVEGVPGRESVIFIVS